MKITTINTFIVEETHHDTGLTNIITNLFYISCNTHFVITTLILPKNNKLKMTLKVKK